MKRKTRTYEWADGTRSRVKADVALRELKRIERERGDLLPVTIVAEARRTSSPIHAHFDWDDKVAGSRWRLQQAAGLVLAVRYVESEDARPRRSFVCIGRGQGYASIERVQQDRDLAAEVIAAARAQLEAWTERYRDIKEALDLLDEAKGKVIAARQKKPAA